MEIKKEYNYVKLYSHRCRTHDNRTFTAYYAIVQEVKGDTLRDKTIMRDGKPVAMSIRVVLLEKAKAYVEADNHAPYLVQLDPLLKVANDENSYFLTIDKDKDKVVKLDKHGKKHYVLVIRAFKDIEQLERKSITFEDVAEAEE